MRSGVEALPGKRRTLSRREQGFLFFPVPQSRVFRWRRPFNMCAYGLFLPSGCSQHDLKVTSKAESRFQYDLKVTSKAESRFQYIPKVTSKAESRFQYGLKVTSKAESRFQYDPKVTSKAESRFQYIPKVSSKTQSRFQYDPKVSSKAESRFQYDLKVSPKAGRPFQYVPNGIKTTDSFTPGRMHGGNLRHLRTGKVFILSLRLNFNIYEKIRNIYRRIIKPLSALRSKSGKKEAYPKSGRRRYLPVNRNTAKPGRIAYVEM
jgi:hypothetical protein